jgi:phosphoglucosamine mutase
VGKQLFGTDGIRGVAGEYPLDAHTVYALGSALGSVAYHLGSQPEVLIGMDTRESGPWLAQLVAGGLAARNVRTRFAGVVTTPGIAYLTRTDRFVAGVVISASHNPYRDNGLKVFGHSGYKLPDSEEDAIEEEIFRLLGNGLDPAPCPLKEDPGLDQHYLNYLLSTLSAPLDGLRLVVDCGNGAAFRLAPELLRRAGAAVETICAQPDGRNINLGCGALHIEGLQQRLVASGADAGVAFDGDADRAIFVAPSGRIVDGDAVLLISARAVRSAGRLTGDTVVATVMSNLGLEQAFEREGIRMLRTPVGDKYVLEEMIRVGAALGGEQSGHVIYRDYATTGDGLLTALRVFETVRCSGLTLDQLTADLHIFPQKLVNVSVREKRPLAEIPAVAAEIDECERILDGSGRILVRYSGTELLARVMVEAAEDDLVIRVTERIAGAIRREIGVDT